MKELVTMLVERFREKEKAEQDYEGARNRVIILERERDEAAARIRGEREKPEDLDRIVYAFAHLPLAREERDQKNSLFLEKRRAYQETAREVGYDLETGKEISR